MQNQTGGGGEARLPIVLGGEEICTGSGLLEIDNRRRKCR